MHHAPEILKKSGHKITPQRLAVWHLLAEGGHYTAEEIFLKLEKTFPGIDRSTIYRTLELLNELKLVQETRFSEGPGRYEATEHIGHHHLACRACGEMIHFEDKHLNSCLKKMAERHQFGNAQLEVCLLGICVNCQEDNKVI